MEQRISSETNSFGTSQEYSLRFMEHCALLQSFANGPCSHPDESGPRRTTCALTRRSTAGYRVCTCA